MPSTSWRLPTNVLSTPRPVWTVMLTTRRVRPSGPIRRQVCRSTAGVEPKDGTRWHSSRYLMRCLMTMLAKRKSSTSWWRTLTLSSNGRTRRPVSGIRLWIHQAVKATTSKPPALPCSPTYCWKPIVKAMSETSIAMLVSRHIKESSITLSASMQTRPSRWPTVVRSPASVLQQHLKWKQPWRRWTPRVLSKRTSVAMAAINTISLNPFATTMPRASGRLSGRRSRWRC